MREEFRKIKQDSIEQYQKKNIKVKVNQMSGLNLNEQSLSLLFLFVVCLLVST